MVVTASTSSSSIETSSSIRSVSSSFYKKNLYQQNTTNDTKIYYNQNSTYCSDRIDTNKDYYRRETPPRKRSPLLSHIYSSANRRSLKDSTNYNHYDYENDTLNEAKRLLRDVKKAKKKDQRERHSRSLNGQKQFSQIRCCFKEKHGACKNSECKFNHDFDVPKVPQVCKYYVTGSCNKGDNCTHMHNEFPCKYFHIRKFCYHDSNCNFSHEPLNDIGQKIIDNIKKELSHKRYEKAHEAQTLENLGNDNVQPNTAIMTYDDLSDYEDDQDDKLQYFTKCSAESQIFNLNNSNPLLNAVNLNSFNSLNLFDDPRMRKNVEENEPPTGLDSFKFDAVYNPYCETMQNENSCFTSACNFNVNGYTLQNDANDANHNTASLPYITDTKKLNDTQTLYKLFKISDVISFNYNSNPPVGYSNENDPRLNSFLKKQENSILPFLNT